MKNKKGVETSPAPPKKDKPAKLWEQWRDSNEYKEYKKSELPSVLNRMSEFDTHFKMQKERNELMANEFNVRWIDAASGKVQETKHKSEQAAKEKARDLSFSNTPVQVGEVNEEGKLQAQWTYEKGKQKAMDTKKQVSVAPISKKEASALKSNQIEKEKTMATSAKKTAAKAPVAKKAAKITHVKASTRGTAKATAKAVATPVTAKKTGGVRDLFELREGSNKAKLVDALLAAKGKPVPLSNLLKAVYGKASEENKGPITMVMRGIPASIAKNRIKYEFIRTKTEEGVVQYALKSK